jgi:hypothetical protein
MLYKFQTHSHQEDVLINFLKHSMSDIEERQNYIFGMHIGYLSPN